MAYATPQEMLNRYDEDALYNAAGKDENGDLDSVAVERALDDASAEIDTYVAAKYNLPLSETPQVLLRLCVDIAMYRLPSDQAATLELHRDRYKDAIALLRDISSGKASLGLDTPPPSIGGGVIVSGPQRLFSRDKLRGF